MNWQKVIIAGVVGGIVLWFYDFLMYGVVMGSIYPKYPVFNQEEGNILTFLLVEVCLALGGALLFGKTRKVWGNGLMAGVNFGVFLGIPFFFAQFFPSMVYAGFPYHLSWCFGSITLIGWVVFGIVASLLYKDA
ncbi:MAG TPA: hypothetical protein PKV71_17775 [Calditrichia bacterium]|nr:hypothetical protein [Calditrichota bacterium]HQU73663.1 hypothetical protein [Calditrichia bacterium]HQV33740.1 hypothetical protein [Calditrichia bacterium]